MKLINNKYRMKAILPEGNKARLITSMDESIKELYPTNISDYPKSIISLRNKMQRLLRLFSESHLMYSDGIKLNYLGELVMTWFKHCGTANISLVVRKGEFTIHYKSNNTKTLVEKDIHRMRDTFLLVRDVLNEFPDIDESS